MLHYVILFTTLLMTAVHVRAQCERPVLGGNQVLAESYPEPFSEGVTLKVSCATGYVPSIVSSKRSITCSGNQWSKLELECKKKSCGNPGEIYNGRYQFQATDGILFGATITAVCNEGYMLVGQSSRNCRVGGWDGRAPVCEVVRCETPPRITDGEFEPEDENYDYGQTVTYICKRGLHLIGSSEITCSSDGTFQPNPPECRHVSCERPTITNAVRIEGKSPPYTYKNFVRYQCNKGYRMEGSDYLTCTENGWNPPPPNCTVITCPKPSEIDDGFFEPRSEIYKYGQTVTYSCNEGFKLRGEPTISCTEEETFQMHPSCEVITCDSPFDPHGHIEGSLQKPYKYNDSVHINCEKGYTIKKSNHLTCKENGWNPALPLCLIVKCPPPPSIPNGELNPKQTVYSYGERVTYSCKKGFRLEGDRTTSCSEDETFKPLSASGGPQCLVVTCPAPAPINHGGFTQIKVSYNYGDRVTYLCKEGFHLEGAETAVCTEHGKFEPSSTAGRPWCKEHQEHSSPWIWISVILAVLLLVLLGICCYCYKKYRKPKEAKVPSRPENCSLVNMFPKDPTTEESASKSTAESLQII